MNVAHSARIALIKGGKVLPFFICAIVLISYTESIIAVATNDYNEYNDYVALNKPLSFFIGSIFEYDTLTVVVTLIISVAIDACIINRLAVLYLAIHLCFKSYIESIETTEIDVVAISAVNIIICGWFCWRGVGVITSK